jgi:hypothetical protein
MIQFYIERQPDDLLKASFYGEDNELIGFTQNITIEQIDSAVNDMFPNLPRMQIFEKPNE